MPDAALALNVILSRLYWKNGRVPIEHFYDKVRKMTAKERRILATLPGVKRLASTSTADGAELQIQFHWGHDLDIVRMQVSEKIDQVRGSLPPTLRT